jgi:hypothetical protein
VRTSCDFVVFIFLKIMRMTLFPCPAQYIWGDFAGIIVFDQIFNIEETLYKFGKRLKYTYYLKGIKQHGCNFQDKVFSTNLLIFCFCKGNNHRYLLLILEVRFSEFENKFFLFKYGSYKNINRKHNINNQIGHLECVTP